MGPVEVARASPLVVGLAPTWVVAAAVGTATVLPHRVGVGLHNRSSSRRRRSAWGRRAASWTCSSTTPAPAPCFAHPAGKAVLNSLTVWLAAELQDTSIEVDSVCPGIDATDMNSDPSGQHPSEGAEVAVRAALLLADGPTGTFFDGSGPVPW